MPPLFLALWGPWGECLDIQEVLPPLGFLGRRGGTLRMGRFRVGWRARTLPGGGGRGAGHPRAPGGDVRPMSSSWGQPRGACFAAAISGWSVASVPRSPVPGQAGSRCRQLLPFFLFLPWDPWDRWGWDEESLPPPPRHGWRWRSSRPLGISPPPPALFSSRLNPAYVSVWWAAVKIALGLS